MRLLRRTKATAEPIPQSPDERLREAESRIHAAQARIEEVRTTYRTWQRESGIVIDPAGNLIFVATEDLVSRAVWEQRARELVKELSARERVFWDALNQYVALKEAACRK